MKRDFDNGKASCQGSGKSLRRLQGLTPINSATCELEKHDGKSNTNLKRKENKMKAGKAARRAELRERREAEKRSAEFMRLHAWRAAKEKLRVDAAEESGGKAFDVPTRPKRLRRKPRLELCACKDERGAGRRLFASRKIAELTARFREQFLNERLEVFACPNGKGFHVANPKFAACMSEVRGEFDLDSGIFGCLLTDDDSLGGEELSGKGTCECKTEGGKPKPLYLFRPEAAKEARKCEKLFGRRVLVCECPGSECFHLSYWRPRKAENSSGASKNICSCKDETGKPSELFWNRKFAGEVARERFREGGKPLGVFRCREGKGFHVGSEESGFSIREMRGECGPLCGEFPSMFQDDFLGEAFGPGKETCAGRDCESSGIDSGRNPKGGK